MCLFERITERRGDSEKKIIHLLVYSPDGHNYKDRTRLKPGTRIFFHVSHVGIRDPSTKDTLIYLSWTIIRLLGYKWSSQDRNSKPYGMLALKDELYLEATLLEGHDLKKK